MIAPTNLTEIFGQIDIYLFDQILRGRIPQGSRVLDAGCGSGRNIHYLLNAGYDVSAADADPNAISEVMRLAADLNASLPPTNFRREPVEAMSFPDESMDVVLSIAVVHFALSDEQFEAMLESIWRVLKPGGMFFCRLASNIGMEFRMVQKKGRRHLLPDGTERYLVDEALLMEWTNRLGAVLLDPLKTTIVQNQRCMTTWAIRKLEK
ncbi:MAG TPA: class I SAM-dependent methyltransferase [Vicinamibacteria bacterium]|nr:class I SAM-dependent methyltransferase [Vicinamibacteria bacterium]HRB12230.1 class I SAM-dependent methyltransferase [Vicinamibacteria bacterium]